MTSPLIRSPHWVALGRPPAARRAVVHRIHDKDIAVWTTPDGRVCAADNVCGHRGASLVDGGTVTDAGALRCCYHGRAVFGAGHRVVVDHDFAWYAWGDADALGDVPTCPEFSMAGYRTFSYAKVIECNPVLMAENTLDWAHLGGSVHRVKFVEGDPAVTVLPPRGLSGMATYTYQTAGAYDLTIENEFWAPFTTCLRFNFRHIGTGELLPPLLLWFSLEPSAQNKTTLHLRVARGLATHPMFDWVFRLVDELPLNEDAWLVQRMYPEAWSSNALTMDDAFVATYRDAMRAAFPDLLAAYVQ